MRIGRRVDVLERSSREDAMTGIGNRRHWEASLRREVDRALRSRMPLSVLMLDVDNLKLLNDAHGHGCGDHALALVGEVLRDTCRSRDVSAVRSLVCISIGVADLDAVPAVGRSSDAATADLLFESADRALYTAKSRGRDRIEVIEVPCISGVIRLDEHRAARKGRVSA